MLCQNGIRASYPIFMGFNSYNYRYTNYYEDPLEAKRDMFEDVPLFWVLMIDMDMKIVSTILRISFLFWFENEINSWYAKQRPVGEAFAWWTKNCKYCVTWPRMKIYLRHRYLPSFISRCHFHHPCWRNQSQLHFTQHLPCPSFYLHCWSSSEKNVNHHQPGYKKIFLYCPNLKKVPRSSMFHH